MTVDVQGQALSALSKLAQADWPDRLKVRKTFEKLVYSGSRASFRFAYDIRNEAGESVATGSTLHACWDPATSKMIAVPPWLVAIMPVVEGAPELPSGGSRV